MHSENFENAFYAVTEPYCDKYGNLKFVGSKDLTIVKSDRTVIVDNNECKEKVRAAVIHSKHLPITPVTQHCSRDLAAGIISFQPKGRAAWQKKQLCIISAYWDIKRESIPEELVNLLNYAEAKMWEIQVHMDSNAHSTLFGSKDQNKRGDLLEDLLASHGLIPMNVGNEPTFYGGTGSATLIDVTFGTPWAASQCRDWRVHKSNIMDSDHRLIQMSMTIDEPIYEYSRDMSRINWNRFRGEITRRLTGQEKLPLVFTIEEIESQTNLIQETIIEVLDLLAPVSRRRTRTRLPWWTDELDELWRRRNELRSLRRTTKGQRRKIRQVTAQFNKLQRFEKRKAERTKFSECNTPKLVAQLNKTINSQPRNQIGLLKREDGSFTETVDESMELILGQCFPGSQRYTKTSDEEKEEIKQFSESRGKIRRHSRRYLSVGRMRQALSSTKNHKAAGPDDIKPSVLKNLPDDILQRILQLYEGCLSSGYTPLAWRKSNVIMIPKPGKPSYQEPKAFRPITLSNHLFKLMEKMVLWHITETTMRENPLSKNQHAFRCDTSTEIAALNVVTQIENAKKNKKFTVAVFADISGAFDCVSGEAIIDAMRRRGIEESLVDWYEQYISNRIARLQVQSSVVNISLSRGCPQGGCLSTLAWNLCFDDLLREFEKLGVNIVGFADDAVLLVSGTALGPLFRRMNSAIKVLCRWAQARRLKISETKTVGMVFQKTRNIVKIQMPNIKLGINGKPLKMVNSAVYLGFTLTSNLKWADHIKNKVGAAKRKLFKFRSAIKPNWGPPHLSTRWLYTSVVRPAVTYGALVWGNSVQNEKVQDDLRRLQGLGLMQQGLFRRNTPRRGLEVISAVEPLHLQIYGEVMKSAERNAHHIGNLRREYPYMGEESTVNKIWKEMKKLGLVVKEDLRDRMVKRRVFERDYQCLPFGDGRPTVCDENINIFTDGSKLNDKVGSGVFIDGHNHKIEEEMSIHLPDSYTVFLAEIAAVFYAAETLLQQDRREEKIMFYIDSQAAILALMGDTVKSKWVMKTMEKVHELGTSNQVWLSWVKAHNNFAPNEKADELAKAGANLVNGPEFNLPVPIGYNKQLIEDEVQRRWKTEWMNVEGHRQTKMFFPYPDKKRALQLYSTNKGTFSQAVRWITGHNGLRYHNHKINPGQFDDPTCGSCGLLVDETSHHVLSECPQFLHERMNAFQVYEDIDLSKINMRQLISFLKNKKCVRLESVSEFPLLFVEDYNKEVDAIMYLTNPSLSLPQICDTPWNVSLDVEAGTNLTSPEADTSMGTGSSNATIGTLPHDSTLITHGEDTNLAGNQQNVCGPTNCSYSFPHTSDVSNQSAEIKNNVGQSYGEDSQLSAPHGTEMNMGFASAERNSVSEDREGMG